MITDFSVFSTADLQSKAGELALKKQKLLANAMELDMKELIKIDEEITIIQNVIKERNV